MAVVLAVVAVTAFSTGPPHGSGMLVAPMPAYIGPGDTARWAALMDSTGKLPAEVVLNPDNGDQVFGDDWQRLAASLHRRSVRVLGYVYTDYGRRPAAEVRASIDNYFPPGVVAGVTGVDGLFLDQFGTTDATGVTCAGMSYYGGIVSYADKRLAASARSGSAPPGGVWGNPGVSIPECYLALPVRTYVTAENTEHAYLAHSPYNVRLANGVLSDGRGTYPPSRFAHLVYDVPASDVHTMVDRAYRWNAGSIFTTEYAATDPQQRFPAPAYLRDLVTYAASHAIA